jgi:hypothetical protein
MKPSKEDYDTANTPISLEQIRQAGICRHYEQLRDQGLSARECLEKTAEFAGISKRHTKGILTDKKQPTGRKTIPFLKHLSNIETTAAALEGSGKQKRKVHYNEIRREIQKRKAKYNKINSEIQNDPNLDDEEKRSLKAVLDAEFKRP